MNCATLGTPRRYLSHVWSILTILLTAVLLTAVLLLSGCAARAPEAAPAPAAESSSGGALDDASVAQGDGIGLPGVNRKMVARAIIELVVQDTAATVDEIRTLSSDLGGYVSDANLYKDSYTETDLLRGSLVLRVPAERLDEALDRLEALALDVRTKNISREDVTDQYSDVDAQLRNLQAAEEELRGLLAEVRARPDATPEDILTVYHSLTEIRGQIEQLQGRKNMLDNLIALSTIEVILAPDLAQRPVVEEGWRPGVVLRNAVRALVTTLQFLVDALIWLGIYVLPVVILLAIPFVILFLAVRWFLKRSRRRKEETAGTVA